jgi:hypothetical protein
MQPLSREIAEPHTGPLLWGVHILLPQFFYDLANSAAPMKITSAQRGNVS